MSGVTRIRLRLRYVTPRNDLSARSTGGGFTYRFMQEWTSWPLLEKVLGEMLVHIGNWIKHRVSHELDISRQFPGGLATISPFLAAALLTAASLAPITAHAQDATWAPVNLGTTRSLTDPGNWSPSVVPTGIATFGETELEGKTPTTTAATTFGQITFTSLAASYSFSISGGNTLTLNNTGITNAFPTSQTFVVLPESTLLFTNSSSAGNSTIGFSIRGGTIRFADHSTAGSASFEDQSDATLQVAGNIYFTGNSTAGNAVISNNFHAATITFQDASTAGSATISNTSANGPSLIIFKDTSNAGSAVITSFTPNSSIVFQGTSNAGNATVTTNSADTITFAGASTGGQARLITNSGGVFDMSALTTAGMTAGSIEGVGDYFLGSKQLTVGLNNLSTQVSGVIADGGAAGGTGGSLIKVGSGTLTLSGANTYTGTTTVTAGTLAAGAVNTLPGLTALTVENPGTLNLAGFNQSIGSLAGDGAVTLGNATLTTGNDGTSTTFSGVMSGSGVLDKVGTGTFILAGNNTYTGGTTIGAGTLQLGNGGTSGGIAGNVVDNGTLAFNRSDVVTFPGVISGTGSLAQIGTGATILNATNTYTGTTTVTSGTLAIGDATHSAATLSGGGAVSVAPGATLGGYGGVAGSVANQGTIAAGNALTAFAGGPVGTFTIGGGLLNQATVKLAGSSIGNTLDVSSNYASAGGALTINTLLNVGGPLSDQVTDRLLIGGNASGVTSTPIP